ncbi:Type II secretion system protein D [Acinetobacter oleivorans]|uniref:type II secretion system secretin GspD n=1 Tax=Acinetobacter oleivorans TaxID=1148157 RepID=UPI0021F0024D|nr:Type II secretion system protein D [Acinetobacter oleivorans]CAI3163749.1 Type II secretion system protein D [Acinetobacter oleivorans]CAI3164215.1 Type II secretion system protein D [Acinetobacter oleivorans]CAI3164243.1 Type II secretion system protein D [Acinetobacter oleivorans]CAI3164272.1 Type II secretion system protein D [Acinetobacter oleivorans]
MALLNHQRPLWALLAAAPLIATVSSSVYAQTWKINLRDADLTAFINEVADITGKNFAVDPRVRGNVTVISNKPLNKDEVYDLFLGVLNVNGVVAIPSGNTIKLVPDSNVKNSGIPYDSRNRLRGDQIVTRVIWLENTNPNDLIPALRPLMPQFAHMAAIAGTNALIVSDRAANIYQLENIIRNLDGTGQNDIEAISLQSSQAEEIITQLEAMSATGASKDFNGARIRIIADNRTNRILVKGDPETRKRIRHMIEMLDVPSADRLGGLKVFRLKYASAKNLSEILQGLVTGQPVSSSNGGGAVASSGGINNSMVNGQNSGPSGSSISTPSINLNNSSNSNQSNITSFSQGGVSIIADNAQNSLVVKADPQLMREIESAIQQLDVRRQQVLIEAAIIEVSGDDADQLGIQWALGDLSSGIGLLSFSNIGASLSSIAAGYLSSGTAGAANAIASGKNKGDGATFALGNFENSRKAYGALIQALKTNTKSNLLSTPSIVTMDNEEAYIVVGQNVPFVTGSVSTGSSGTVNPYTTVERKDVGVTLKVIPHIGEGGTVRLEVEQEVSNVQSSKGQAADLITNKRAIKTAVLAEHGQTVVLGGLVSDDVEFNRQGIPGLSSIPYVGRLFRSDTRSNVKRNLLVFIHPTIVGDANDVRRLSQQRYNQLYSLQLAMDKNGNFAKLPEQVDDVYNQKMTPPSIASQPKNYQQVPSGGKSSTVTTPVAVQPSVQRQTLQLPEPEVNRTKNTVTTTTLRPSTAP